MNALAKHTLLFLYTIPTWFQKGHRMRGFLCRSVNTHIRGVLFEKGTDSVPGGPALMASAASKDPPPYYHHIMVSTDEFWGDASI